MSQQPETVGITTTLVGGAVPAAGKGLAILAPHTQSGQLVSPNVVEDVALIPTAEALFGAGSLLANGFTAAKNSGIGQALMVGVAAKTTAPETFGNNSAVTTGQLTPANAPITAIVSVTKDGTPIVAPNILFTELDDPATVTVGAAQVCFSMTTGKWKLGSATAGTGLGGLVVTYTAHDWDTAFSYLDLNPYEYAVPAGVTFSKANWGVVKKFAQHAADQNKMLTFACDSGVLPSDVSALFTAVQGNARYYLVFAYYTGDMTCAMGAELAASQTRSTRKLQPAPAGVSYTGTYLFTQFGGELNPSSGTIHYMGGNAVYTNPFGVPELTNDRAPTVLTDPLRFHSSKRMVRDAEERFNGALLALRRSSDVAITYSQAGLAQTRQSLEAVAHGLLEDQIIDEVNIQLPRIDDFTPTERAERMFDQIQVSIRLTGQVHFIALNLRVEV